MISRERGLGTDYACVVTGHERRIDTIYPDTEIRPRKTVDRLFSKAHAMSIHLNLVTIAATLGYGLQLAARMRWDTT